LPLHPAGICACYRFSAGAVAHEDLEFSSRQFVNPYSRVFAGAPVNPEMSEYDGWIREHKLNAPVVLLTGVSTTVPGPLLMVVVAWTRRRVQLLLIFRKLTMDFI